jgi:hypothetical protein
VIPALRYHTLALRPLRGDGRGGGGCATTTDAYVSHFSMACWDGGGWVSELVS